jgi:ketosteroid isomerase-like protein
MSDDETIVRRFFDAYSGNRPELFDEVVTDDYEDFGHTPPGRGPQGARDDLAGAVAHVGAPVRYDIDALVAHDEVAVAWTGHLPDGDVVRGLSLYTMRDGRISATRHAAIGDPPR